MSLLDSLGIWECQLTLSDEAACNPSLQQFACLDPFYECEGGVVLSASTYQARCLLYS